MTHSYGNYVVQMLLEVCDKAQRIQILQRITRKYEDLVKILCHMHGLASLSLFISNICVIVQLVVIVLLNFSSQPQGLGCYQGH
jgi:hypothetical protein